MKTGDIVKIKSNFKEELNKLGFCGTYAHFVSMGFSKGFLKIQHIRHEDQHNMDIAMFSPFLEVPVQCLELLSGEDLIREFKANKRNELENPIQYVELKKEK